MSADGILARLELTYGRDRKLQEQLRPIVDRILSSGPACEERKKLLQLVSDVYRAQMSVHKTLRRLHDRLRRRLNDRYGKILGIEPPGLHGLG